MSTTADAVFESLLARLNADAAKPTSLTIKPFPVIDLENTDLPYMGLRLTEGDMPTGQGEDMAGGSERACKIHVEIWAKGDNPLFATKCFREWLLAVIYADENLGGLANRIEFGGFEADVGVLEGWVGLVVAEFTFFYFWRP
jgi:hypothetical protein